LFKDIIGQDTAIKILEAALKNKRWASSYLFVGSEGVGKRLTAVAFAQALNCLELIKETKQFDACGKCLPCRKIDQDNHPDVQLITPEEDKASISIDQIRAVQKNAFLKPMEGRQKVYIIDDAGRLTPEAMNCFLKILEEPPDRVVFMLITKDILQLLETIVSRCQVIKFSPLSRKEVEVILTKKGNMNVKTAHLLSAISAGSVGMAMDYHDYGVVLERENMVKLIDEVSMANVSFLFREAERLAKDKNRVQVWLNLLASFWRDILVSRIFTGSADKQAVEDLLINADMHQKLKDKLTNCSVATLKGQIEIILNTKALIQKNVNPRLGLENMFLRLTETENR
jgi:DNA polymerase III subunit delta'